MLALKYSAKNVSIWDLYLLRYFARHISTFFWCSHSSPMRHFLIRSSHIIDRVNLDLMNLNSTFWKDSNLQHRMPSFVDVISGLLLLSYYELSVFVLYIQRLPQLNETCFLNGSVINSLSLLVDFNLDADALEYFLDLLDITLQDAIDLFDSMTKSRSFSLSLCQPWTIYLN